MDINVDEDDSTVVDSKLFPFFALSLVLCHLPRTDDEPEAASAEVEARDGGPAATDAGQAAGALAGSLGSQGRDDVNKNGDVVEATGNMEPSAATRRRRDWRERKEDELLHASSEEKVSSASEVRG